MTQVITQNGWVKTTLGEVAVVVTGKTPPTANQDFYGAEYPFITPTDIRDGENFCEPERCLSEEGRSFQKSLLLPPNSICYTCIASVGKICLTKRESFTNQQINSLKVNEDEANYKFLFYALKHATPRIKQIAGGTTTAIINKTQFENFPIPLPPLPEQRAIAAVLSSLDDKIELLREQNKTLEETAQTIFREWFGRYSVERPEELPEGWRVGKIYEILNVQYGFPFKSSSFNEEKNGFPLIRIRDLKDGSPAIFTDEKFPEDYLVTRGDILAGMDAEFRPVIWKGNDGGLNQRVCKFLPKNEKIGNLFVLEFIRPHLNFFEKTKHGTTVSHLGKSDLDSIETAIPPENVIEKFSIITNPIFGKIVNNYSQIQTLSTLRDALLPRLMRGEVRVKF